MSKLNILYLSYTGLLEPLGRSQVMAYLMRLSKDYDIRLVTYEKKADMLKSDEMLLAYDECKQYAIDWRPIRYHHRPRLLATGYDLLLLVMQIIFFIVGTRGKKVIHCRGYVTSTAAWLISRLFPVEFIFDMRALWPEEMIEAESLKRNSLLHKLLIWLERRMIRDAASVVSLTHAAVFYLKEVYPESSIQNFVVIPTCVDLTLFSNIRSSLPSNFNVGVMGTILSGWYHDDWLFHLFQIVKEYDSNAKLKIVSRDNHSQLIELAKRSNVNTIDIVLDEGTPAQIPFKIADMSFAVLFFTSGLSKLGSSPTRMAEFLALGIPVIANSGVGDMSDIILKYRVGVVVASGSDEELRKGFLSMVDLLNDLELPSRCRAAAVEYFSVDSGAESYRLIYNSL